MPRTAFQPAALSCCWPIVNANFAQQEKEFVGGLQPPANGAPPAPTGATGAAAVGGAGASWRMKALKR